MKIGELAGRTGVSVRSLRYYEEQQLLAPERTTGGQRVFGDDAVDRVTLIQLLFGAGLTSRNVIEILPCLYSGSITPAMFDRLQGERQRIDEQVRSLSATRDRLDGVIAEAAARLTA